MIQLAGLICLAMPAAGYAQTFIKGTQITQNCNSRSAQDQTACNTYIAGALDQVANSPELKKTVCVPYNTTLEELRHALGRFGVQRPEEAKRSAATLIDTMMRTNYPCPVQPTMPTDANSDGG